MAEYTQASFPLSQPTLSDGGKWVTTYGSGVGTDGSGVVTAAAGLHFSSLTKVTEEFGRAAYARVTIGTLAGAMGVGLINLDNNPSDSGGIAVFATSSTTLLIRSYPNSSNFGSYTTELEPTISELTGNDTLEIAVTDNVAADTQNWEVYVNSVSVASGTFEYKDATTSGVQPSVVGSDGSGIVSLYAADAFVVSPTIATAPSTIARGETGLTLTGTNFEASQGTGGVTLGGEAATVTAWSDTSVTFTVPDTISLKHSATGYPITLVTDGGASTSTANVPFTPQAGFGYADQVDPVTNEYTVWSAADLAATGFQGVYATTTTNGREFSVDTRGFFLATYGTDPVVSDSFYFYHVEDDGTYQGPPVLMIIDADGQIVDPGKVGAPTRMRISGGELQIDGTSLANGVLYPSPDGGLTTIPNGEPFGKFDVSGGSLNGITEGPVYIGPSGEFTATPNGRPRGLLR